MGTEEKLYKKIQQAAENAGALAHGKLNARQMAEIQTLLA